MRISEFFFSDVGADTRSVLPINEPITGTVPLQHIFSAGITPIEKLPIVRECLGFITDTINETDSVIINKRKEVVFDEFSFPKFIKQPSVEFVFEELVGQAVTSLFTSGDLRLLAMRAGTKPIFMYVGSPSLVSYKMGDGSLIYYDYLGTPYTGDHSIVANSVVHRRRLAFPGKPLGISQYEPGKTLINTALHAQDLIQYYFANNMHLDLIFTKKGEYVKGSGLNLLTALAQRHSGPKNSYKPLVDDYDWNIERLSDSNQANQVMELCAMVDTKICTQVFGIDPLVFSISNQVASGTNLTYQNASNLRTQVWLKAVKPVARIIASAISEYLPNGQYFRFDAHDFLLGGPSDRAALVEKMALVNKHTGKEVFTVEEMRGVLGMIGAPEVDADLASKITGIPTDDMMADGDDVPRNGNVPVGVG